MGYNVVVNQLVLVLPLLQMFSMNSLPQTLYTLRVATLFIGLAWMNNARPVKEYHQLALDVRSDLRRFLRTLRARAIRPTLMGLLFLCES